MKHARSKADSVWKKSSAMLAQLLAVTAMLVIAGFVFYVR